jgi:hypothetical protein
VHLRYSARLTTWWNKQYFLGLVFFKFTIFNLKSYLGKNFMGGDICTIILLMWKANYKWKKKTILWNIDVGQILIRTELFFAQGSNLVYLFHPIFSNMKLFWAVAWQSWLKPPSFILEIRVQILAQTQTENINFFCLCHGWIQICRVLTLEHGLLKYMYIDQ